MTEYHAGEKKRFSCFSSMLLLYKNEPHIPHKLAVAFLKKYISQYKEPRGLLKFNYYTHLLLLS